MSDALTVADDEVIGFVARFNICALWKYAFVVGEPYVRDGILDSGVYKISAKSIATWRK